MKIKKKVQYFAGKQKLECFSNSYCVVFLILIVFSPKTDCFLKSISTTKMNSSDVSETASFSDSISPRPNRTVCIVPGCHQRYGRGCSFHAFPKKDDKKRYKMWLRKLGLKFEPTTTSRVCSEHFSISNFVVPSKFKSVFWRLDVIHFFIIF